MKSTTDFIHWKDLSKNLLDIELDNLDVHYLLL